MATLNLTKGTAGAAGISVKGLNKVFVLRNKIDHSIAANNLAQNDVAQVLNVPANTFVLRAGYKVLTAEGAAAAGTLGDGADADGYIAAVDLNAVASVLSAGVTVGFALGKHYTAADTIDLVYTSAAALNVAVVEYYAIAIDLN